jgi:hypothetical protein
MAIQGVSNKTCRNCLDVPRWLNYLSACSFVSFDIVDRSNRTRVGLKLESARRYSRFYLSQSVKRAHFRITVHSLGVPASGARRRGQAGSRQQEERPEPRCERVADIDSNLVPS